MPENKSDRRDVVIIGGGHNGLVTAFYLAKAGFKPLVLERRPQVGGAAVTDEFHPGFRCSTLAHTAGPIRPDIVRDMNRIMKPDAVAVIGACTTPEKYAVIPSRIIAPTGAFGTSGARICPIPAPIDRDGAKMPPGMPLT